MSGPQQALQGRHARFGPLRGAALVRARCACLSGAFAPGARTAARGRPTAPRRRQRPAAPVTRVPGDAGLEVGRRHPARQRRVAPRRLHLRDGARAAAQQGELVRRDMEAARQARRIRSRCDSGIRAKCVQGRAGTCRRRYGQEAPCEPLEERIPYPASRNREGLYSSVWRNRERPACSVRRSYPGRFAPLSCSVSRTPSRYAICCASFGQGERECAARAARATRPDGLSGLGCHAGQQRDSSGTQMRTQCERTGMPPRAFKAPPVSTDRSQSLARCHLRPNFFPRNRHDRI